MIDRYKFYCSDIYKVDETGITNVQRSDRTFERTGVKQVGSLTSAEWGTLVIIEIAVNATANMIPPIILFTRKNYRGYFVAKGPPGCIGLANQSGWMNSDDFFKFLDYFVKHIRCTLKISVLLLLDNHEYTFLSKELVLLNTVW